MSPLNLSQLQEITRGRLRVGARLTDAASLRIGSIATDSRYVLAGDTFWALRGARHDGAHFAGEAFARGAAGVVVQTAGLPLLDDRWLLEVDDTQEALTRLAAWRRSRFAGRVIAVTGSVAKSTTREMLNGILRQSSVGVASPRSFNNRIGLPLSMLELDETFDYGLFELGANRPGEIDQMAELCRPQMGIITAAGDAHFGSFGGYEAIARAKCELLARIAAGGLAVLNGDCQRLRRAAADWRGRKIWFGRRADADVVATHVEYRQGRLAFRVEGDRFEAPVWGRHHLLPALAALTAARALGATSREIADGLAQFEPLAHRSVVRRVGELTLIDDSYNASPSAMQAALELLRETEGSGRKIAVLGDMLELGDQSAPFHRLIGDLTVTRCSVDVLIACGRYAEAMTAAAVAAGMPADRALACSTPDQAWRSLRDLLQPDDVVLVKASRAMGLERLIIALETEWQASGERTWHSGGMPADEIPTRESWNRTFGTPSPVPSLREFGAAHPPG